MSDLSSRRLLEFYAAIDAAFTVFLSSRRRTTGLSDSSSTPALNPASQSILRQLQDFQARIDNAFSIFNSDLQLFLDVYNPPFSPAARSSLMTIFDRCLDSIPHPLLLNLNGRYIVMGGLVDALRRLFIEEANEILRAGSSAVGGEQAKVGEGDESSSRAS